MAMRGMGVDECCTASRKRGLKVLLSKRDSRMLSLF